MHRAVFFALVTVFFVSLYSVSECINSKVITSAQKGEKRPTKKGARPLSEKVTEAYGKAKLPRTKNAISHRDGLNFDPCETDFDCKGFRYCYGYSEAGILGYCDFDYNIDCRCLSFEPFCYEDGDCSPGEHCSPNVLPSHSFCVSNNLLPDSDGGSSPVDKPGSNGAALDYCMSASDCKGSHKCYMIDADGWYVDCNSFAGKECFCDYDFDAGFDGECTSDADCYSGEICPSFSFETDWCVSDTAYQGFNFDFCYSSDDCREPRSCYNVAADGTFSLCSLSDDSCVCLKENTYDMLCSDLLDCAFWAESCYEDYESGLSICVSDAQLAWLRAKSMSGAVKKNMLTAEPAPAESAEELEPVKTVSNGSSSSPESTPNASEPSENVCIAVHLLGHLESHELLYDTHRVARVLCDSSNSCATPGHIVQYEGKAMMMKNYCEVVGCTTDVMKVNSPRYQRGMQVPSMSKDLVFTAFAARYGTKTEERLLATAVRFGL